MVGSRGVDLEDLVGRWYTDDGFETILEIVEGKGGGEAAFGGYERRGRVDEEVDHGHCDGEDGGSRRRR